MRKIRRLPALILAFIMVVGLVPATQVHANTANTVNPLPPITVSVNGQLVTFADQQPIMVENRVLVPVRGVFEMMGFTATWDDAQRIARLTRSDVTVVIPAASTSFVVNNTIITPEVPQRMVGGRLLLPLRAVAEAIGGVPEWDNVNRRAIITTAAAPSPTPTPTPTPAPATTPVPLITAAPRFEGNPVGFGTGGNAYMGGVRRPNSIWGGGHSHHNLNREYATLIAYIGRFDDSGAAARTLTLIGDGHVLARYTVSGTTFVPQRIVVDVRNVTILRIEIEAVGSDGVNFVLGTPMLHRTHPTNVPTPTPRPSPAPAQTPVPIFTAGVNRVDGSTNFGMQSSAVVQSINRTGAIVAGGGGWATYSLGGRFNTLTGYIARADNTGTEARTITFRRDNGTVIQTFTVSSGAPVHITVPVQGVNNLRIDIEAPGTSGASIVFYNTLLHFAPTVATTPVPLHPTRSGGDPAAFGHNISAFIHGQTAQFTNAIWGGGWATYNLGGRYTRLEGYFGRQQGSGTEQRTVTFIGDNRTLGTLTVTGTTNLTPFSFDVSGVTTLRIEMAHQGINGASVVLANVMLRPTGVATTPTPTPTPGTTPVPFLTNVSRVDGTAGFGWGATANMQGLQYHNAIWNTTGVNAWASYALNGNFNTFTATIGRLDSVAGWETRNIRFIGDGNLIHSFPVSGNEGIRQISINVQNVTTLRIEIDAHGANGVSIVMADATLTRTTGLATTPAPLLTGATRTGGTQGFGESGSSANMNGTHHTNAIWNNTASTAWATYNLGGRWHTFTTTVGRMDVGNNTAGRRIRIINSDTGTVLAEQLVSGHSFTPVTITADVRNVNVLRIEIDAPGSDGVTVLMVNAMLSHTATTLATTPAPLLTGATRTGGTAGFGVSSGSANMNGSHHTNAIWNNTASTAWATYNLGGRWHTFTATIGRMDSGNQAGSRRIRIINGDSGAVLVERIVYGSSFAPVFITATVQNVHSLRVEIDAPGNDGVTIMMVNAMLHHTAVAATATTLASFNRTGGTPDFGLAGTNVTLGNNNYINSMVGGGTTVRYTVHHLNRQFTSFEATLGGILQPGSETRYVRIMGGDGNTWHVLPGGSFRVDSTNAAPRTISVDVTNITHLRIEIDAPGAHGLTAALGTPRVR